MVYELSQTFHFEAAHTLVREIDAASSKRIHGHTYHAEVTLRGVPDAASGMLMDLGFFRRELAVVQEMLDHHLLDEVAGLTKPTLEGLCAFIAEKLRAPLPLLASVKVWRATGDSCKLIVG
ncbi:6-pyruvoyl trahydropterin synthase family protein [Piscinibacter terrae]|uniref:6-carboxy-5,6,7,8-tetrahydropterin synthase n=1 Tax=Piscinibacter terrae TaxID=2496871 RepID=A0A3N7JZY6_9BURK|nr:6-carboxytetrahydropterin synthase [Albitalea terrae]RQP24335.1 6-carboxytetrahydropterin synthase [Albitalea terrae]